MRYLDFRGFGAKLRKLEERAPEKLILPEGLSEEQFNLIERVMTAEKPSDIADISTETIAGLFSFAELYLSIFAPESLFDDRFYSSLSSKKGLITRRRIL